MTPLRCYESNVNFACPGTLAHKRVYIKVGAGNLRLIYTVPMPKSKCNILPDNDQHMLPDALSGLSEYNDWDIMAEGGDAKPWWKFTAERKKNG